MKKPTQIAIKHTAMGLLALLIIVLLSAFFFGSSAGVIGDGSAAAGATTAVFVTALCAATNAAYKQGKKDALVDRQDQ